MTALRPLLLAAMLAAPSTPAPLPASPLPEIGTVAASTMSLTEEARLGEAFMRSIRRNLSIVDDPVVDGYIDGLGRRLTRHVDAPGRRFTFFVVDDPSVNAFAGPGGYIGLHTGLILTARNEAELAAVVAHEIAHVTQRHLARAYEAISASSLPMTAAVIASLIIGSHDAQAGSAALASIAAGSAQRQIDFTRDNEQEADRIGLDILARAGFDPRAMPAFFRRLRQSTRLLDDQGLEFLRTHPVTNARIADTEGRAERYPRTRAGADTDFLLVQARTRVLAGQGEGRSDIDWFRASLGEGTDGERTAKRYGYALTLFQAQRYDEAAQALAPVTDTWPDSVIVQRLEARIEAARGRPSRAIAILEAAHERHPDDWAIVSALARVYLEAKRTEQARHLLRVFMEGQEHPLPPLAFRLRAEIENDLGETARSHVFLAEYYARLDETRAAIRQLRIARKAIGRTGDPQLGKRIQERLKVLERRLEAESSPP